MAYSSPNFAIPAPCVGDDITLADLQNYATATESAISTVSATALKARVRPAATLYYLNGTPYTAGVAVIPSFGLEVLDTDNMFTLAAPTILTINTPGTYLVNFLSASNMSSTNTSHKAEILLNGATVATGKGGSGIAGAGPPNPIAVSTLLPLLVAGNTISVRVTVTGVGNDSTFPKLSAALISYGGS